MVYSLQKYHCFNKNDLGLLLAARTKVVDETKYHMKKPLAVALVFTELSVNLIHQVMTIFLCVSLHIYERPCLSTQQLFGWLVGLSITQMLKLRKTAYFDVRRHSRSLLLPILYFLQSFPNSFIHSFIYSFIHSFTYSGNPI